DEPEGEEAQLLELNDAALFEATDHVLQLKHADLVRLHETAHPEARATRKMHEATAQLQDALTTPDNVLPPETIDDLVEIERMGAELAKEEQDEAARDLQPA